MKEIAVQAKLVADLLNLHQVVVQQATVGPAGAVWAEQLLHQQTDTLVYRGQVENGLVKYDEDRPAAFLQGPKTGLAGGHTQTWEPAGRPKQWLVGTKPKWGRHWWTTQIARLDFSQGKIAAQSNTEFPRLSFLNRAGAGYDDRVVYPGKNLQRVEAAVSPNRRMLLLATIGFDHIGHFALYDLAEVNQKLDAAARQAQDVNVEQLHCLGAFMIPAFNSEHFRSVQGYALDDDRNIYVSSQPSPTANFFGFAKQGQPREIVKIPWGQSDENGWTRADLGSNHELDLAGFVTELEGIHALGNGQLNLTVAYHQKRGLTTRQNRLFAVNGF